MLSRITLNGVLVVLCLNAFDDIMDVIEYNVEPYELLLMTDKQFVDFLFGKMFKHVDMEEIDLTDDDSIMVALDLNNYVCSLIEDSGLRDYIDANAQDPWHDTMFRGYVFMSPKQKGEFGERFVSHYMQSEECLVERAATSTAGHDRVIDDILTEIKFSLATRDKKGGVKKDYSLLITSRDKDWERLIFFGINPDEEDARLVWFSKEDLCHTLSLMSACSHTNRVASLLKTMMILFVRRCLHS